MRFTIEKDQFLKSLNAASKAVPSKSASPYLTNLKLDLNEKGLEILGSNGDISIKATVPYMIGDREVIRNAGLGATLVNSRILTEIVRNVEGNELSVEVIDEAVMKIDDSRSSFKLNCIKAEEYPDIDLERSGTEIKLSCVAFASLVEQSAFAASNKDQRPILTALHLEAENGKLVATATDSAVWPAKRSRSKTPPVSPATFRPRPSTTSSICSTTRERSSFPFLRRRFSSISITSSWLPALFLANIRSLVRSSQPSLTTPSKPMLPSYSAR